MTSHCPTCDMTFPSQELMIKHQMQLCIGPLYVKHHDYQVEQSRDKLVNEQTANYERVQRQQQLQHEAELYRQRMTECRSQTDKLLAQKQALEQRLNELSTAAPAARSVIDGRFLNQLNALQEKNQAALLQVQQQVQILNYNGSSKTDEFILREINAMRQRYLQYGGSNPDILKYMFGIEQRAISLAQHQGEISKTSQEEKDKLKELGEKTAALELENERLQNELTRLHELNNKILETELLNQSASEVPLVCEDYQQHVDDLVAVRTKLDLLSQQARLELLNKHSRDLRSEYLTAPDLFGPLSGATSLHDHVDYDPSAGFVVFLDFVAGLETSVLTDARLLWSLYRGINLLSKPVSSAVMATTSARHERRGSVAIIGDQQPIFPCIPSHDLAMIIELQTAPSAELAAITLAWCKVNLFNEADQLLAGRWKVSFRVPPIDLLSSATRVASYEKYGETGIYLRVVNQARASAESLTLISPGDVSSYQDPADNSSGN